MAPGPRPPRAAARPGGTCGRRSLRWVAGPHLVPALVLALGLGVAVPGAPSPGTGTPATSSAPASPAAAPVTSPAVTSPAVTSPAAAARALCGATGRTVGTLGHPDLTETSGLVWSRSHRGVGWAHNDSGDRARLFAIGRDGSDRGVVEVTGATALDWEDLALGAGPGGDDHLFVGDLGGGAAGARSSVVVYRLREPAPPGPATTVASAPAAALTLRYPDGAHDAEALLVDDRTGDLVVVTKGVGATPQVYRAAGAARAPAGSTIPLAAAGPLAPVPVRGSTRALAGLVGWGDLVDAVTAADASAAAGVVVVRTYGGVAVHRWPARRTLAEALTVEPCAAPAPTDLRFPQGEAIALTPNARRYVTVAEGAGAPLVEFRAHP